MNVERLPAERHGHRYARMPPEHESEGDASSSSVPGPAPRPEVLAASASFRLSEATRVFEELPRATIFSVSRPEAGDITPMLLSYTIEINYKQFRWRLFKKASQVLYLHFALKRREFLEEFHEKQEQVKEWLQNLGIGDNMPVVHDEDEVDDVNVPSQPDESSIRNSKQDIEPVVAEMFLQLLFCPSFDQLSDANIQFLTEQKLPCKNT